MASRLKDFKEEDKIKTLLWCQRHCCLCDKACGTGIEVAHIDPKKKDLDNAVPLCFDCHDEIGKYNKNHPKGNKYRSIEIKTRRDQIYEKYTRELVPPVDFGVTQLLPDAKQRIFPDIGFKIGHLGDFLPVRALVLLEYFVNGKKISQGGGHYGKIEFWNLNPRLFYFGHFTAPDEAIQNPTHRFHVTGYVTIIDQYDRYHELLPVTWVYEKSDNSWWVDP